MIHDERSARQWVETLASSKEAMERLDYFCELLIDECRRQSLVSAKGLEHLWQRHIADSAQLLPIARSLGASGSWLDIGAGAGFPGLILAILDPARQFLLSESRPKRAMWLQTSASSLGLGNVLVAGDARRFAPAAKFAVISARAVGNMPSILALGEPFSTPETLWLLPKGRSAAGELEALANAQSSLFHVKQSLTDPDAGIIVGSMTRSINSGAQKAETSC